MNSAQACDLTNIFEELSQIEKFSEIKPPLGLTNFGFVLLCLETLQSQINRTKTVTHKTEAGNIVSINREIRILSLCTHPA